jgi:hypothetical protein
MGVGAVSGGISSTASGAISPRAVDQVGNYIVGGGTGAVAGGITGGIEGVAAVAVGAGVAGAVVGAVGGGIGGIIGGGVIDLLKRHNECGCGK